MAIYNGTAYVAQLWKHVQANIHEYVYIYIYIYVCVRDIALSAMCTFRTDHINLQNHGILYKKDPAFSFLNKKDPA